MSVGGGRREEGVRVWGRKVCECGECVRRVREDEGEKRVGWRLCG